ncbi:uncharacterized protein Tco025E_07509 [Trypanosoma conorhini]|uniref:Uncharacterized protein n=1 Tax=Trypanosoma conorhini TaxID=83891 RepID=A0A3S5IRH2_9TRYP|nr:uncharacterized protein Tco025E_07509 [Trypanosoma conorhini]RNF06710.1 hypothetical protein Tco025E_07509 [Trypanosoma conorhini]
MWLSLALLHALLLSCATQASAHYAYDGGYDVLRVGEVRYNDTVTFPASAVTEVRRRYVLTGLERGRRYVIHLSYLGSPSMEYRLHVGLLQRSVIEAATREEAAPAAPGRLKLADVAMLQVRTHADNLRFDYIDGDGDVDNADTAAGDLVPVLEVRGKRTAFPAQPGRWRTFSYNLRVEAMGTTTGLSRLVVWHVVLVLTSVVVVVLLVPKLLAAIAGDAPVQTRRRRDFLLFFLNKNDEVRQ